MNDSSANADAGDGQPFEEDASGHADASDAQAPDASIPDDASPSGDANDGSAGDSSVTDGGRSCTLKNSTRPSAQRRLTVPCTAPSPTGFCLRSDMGDWIGGGESFTGSGDTSVIIGSGSANLVAIDLSAPGGNEWRADFAASTGSPLRPGLYDPAEDFPFGSPGFPQLSIGGNGRGCTGHGLSASRSS
jgi:hypothetical protein